MVVLWSKRSRTGSTGSDASASARDDERGVDLRGMKRIWTRIAAMLLLSLSVGLLMAENPATLPIPTAYVNDFAHVLTPAGGERIEALCRAVQDQADAQLFVVTINSLDNGMSVEEFTEQLEEHWKAGKKGQDRSAIFLLVMNPHKLRIETGYGLEGILNDAKVGAILDQVTPLLSTGNYDQAMYTGTNGMAEVIATDKGVTLAPILPQYHYQQAPAAQHGTSLGQILLGVGFVILIIILAKTGNLGWAIYLIMSLMGGGGGGGGRGGGGDGEGGGFGGIGGGESGGGGASRDW